MKKTFNVSEDYEEYHKYFKDKYQKSFYDLMLCELLEVQYKAKENDIDIKILVNTIEKFSVDMEAVIALIYQLYDGSLTSKIRNQNTPLNENPFKKDKNKEDNDYSGLAAKNIDFSCESEDV
jgi:hypothetical protein